MKTTIWSAMLMAVLLTVPVPASAQTMRRSGFSRVSEPPCADSRAMRQGGYWFGTGMNGPLTPRLLNVPQPFPRWEYPYDLAFWNPYSGAYTPYYTSVVQVGNPAASPFGYNPYYPTTLASTSPYATSMPGPVAPAYVPSYVFGVPGAYPATYGAVYPYSANYGSPAAINGYTPAISAGMATAPAPAGNADSNSTTGTASGSSATITIKVPLALTEVICDGKTVTPTGKTRVLSMGGLSAGTIYTYSVTANWSEAGLPRSISRQVQVLAGQAVTVDFTKEQ